MSKYLYTLLIVLFFYFLCFDSQAYTVKKLPVVGCIENVSFMSVDSLPSVVFTSFQTEKKGKSVVINWTTSYENNSEIFAIENSLDASNWITIGTVKAKGESTVTVNYSFTDVSPKEAINYYRLKSVDKNGRFLYSRITSVSLIKPVAIITSFSGVQEGADVKLSWSTSSENKNNYFAIANSLGEVQWDSVGSVSAMGNSETPASYTWLHKNPQPGVNYYLLIAVGKERSYAFERPLKIDVDYITSVEISDKKQYHLFPNPVGEKIYYENNVANPVVRVDIFNALGQQVMTTFKPGLGEIDVKNMSPGLHLVSLTLQNGMIVNRKIIKY